MSSGRRKRLEVLEQQITAEMEVAKTKIPEDPLVFFKKWLEFDPTIYQAQLTKMFMKNQFVAARWNRQSGKSHIVAALLLFYALSNSGICVGVVGPSWRQTKLVIRRINSFLRKLPKGFYQKPQITIVRLSNGSIIEAFPNKTYAARVHSVEPKGPLKKKWLEKIRRQLSKAVGLVGGGKF